MTYTVEMIDRSGTGPQTDFPTLQEAAEYLDAVRTKYGSRNLVYRIYNSDNVDIGWSTGLTEEEEEYLEEEWGI